MAATSGAVSYTHLDVYKRQGRQRFRHAAGATQAGTGADNSRSTDCDRRVGRHADMFLIASRVARAAVPLVERTGRLESVVADIRVGDWAQVQYTVGASR